MVGWAHPYPSLIQKMPPNTCLQAVCLIQVCSHLGFLFPDRNLHMDNYTVDVGEPGREAWLRERRNCCFRTPFTLITLEGWVFCLHVYRCPKCGPSTTCRSEEPAEYPGTRITNGYEPPSQGWRQTQIPCESNRCSKPLSRLSSTWQ